MTRMPRGTRELFARHVKVGDVVAAVSAAHAPVRYMFCSGIGHYLQYLESEILMSVLLRLKDHGVVALPIHDAVLVPASAEGIAYETMMQVFREHTGAEGIVDAVGM